MLGGLIAARFIGSQRAMVIGAPLMSGGHVAMAFELSFLIALALLVTGHRPIGHSGVTRRLTLTFPCS